MANRFTVNPLGGFDLGQGIRGLGQDLRAREEEDRLNLQREQMQGAIRGAVTGDPQAIETLYTLNPKLGAQFEQRQADKVRVQGLQQAEASKQAETGFGFQWHQAKTPEEREALKQVAFENDLIDFDESDLKVGDNQANLAVYSMLYSNLGKDQYKQFIEGGSPEKGTFSIKETPTGFLRLNSATGQVQEIDSNSKIAKLTKAKEEKEFKSKLESANTTFQRSKDIRNRYDKKSGEFTKVRDAYGRIEASIDSPDAAGDLSLIFNYMKMLDPGSTVREGEFATAAGAASVPERMKGAYNKVISGERLTVAQRAQFVNRASKLMSKAESQQSKDKSEAINLGKQWGATEEDLFGQQQVAPAGAPQIGVVEGGYEYIGGDPSKPESWRLK